MNKPIFHITAEKGWMNDPNGVVKFKGQYHIFYQHHPYSWVWGPMHWGHVVSDDLIHFKYLPIALTPGDEFDKNGCFSGTSLVKDDVLYIVYTGFILNKEDEEYNKQIQCLATSEDGVHFKKHGAIITDKDLPKEYKTTDFRDPKLTFKDGYFYLFAAAKKKTGGGSILLYKSKDLKKWEFISDILPHNSEGIMIECVDYHEDLNLLVYSEQCFPKDNDHCLNVSSCEYEIGHLNEQYKFISKKPKTLLDYGFDFYAPQVMNDDHYLIAWLDMWGRNNPSEKYGFAGMLTVPRKVTIENDFLIQTPVIYGKLQKTTKIDSTYTDKISVGTIKLEIKDLGSLSINLREGEDEVTKFYLKDNEFYFDRSKSGEAIYGDEQDELSLKGIRKMPYYKREIDTIYIVLDKYSIEIFVNGISMSNLVYPKETSEGLTISIKSSSNKLEIYK